MYAYLYLCLYLHTVVSLGKESQVIFLNLFIVCSSCQWKFVVYPFIDEETNVSCPFAHGLKGRAHLCTYNICIRIDICLYI
jgi:hypothetical protein